MNALENQVVVVTGAARGLGAAIARNLAAAGATIVLADIRRQMAEDVAAEINDLGGKAAATDLDVTDEQQIQELLVAIVSHYGALNVIVNNAAIDVTLPIDELQIDDWQRVLSVNLSGPFLLSKLAFPVFKRQGSGQIVNIASTAAKRAWANASVYHASKWGLLGLSHALHVEGRPHGIKVTAIVSGGMRTPFLLDRFPDLDPGVLQDPANVAETIRFVLSLPAETVIPEILVLPMRETSWP
ncbi:MAG: SDR family oxidoreductase [Chloroflexota bacterium]